MTRPAHPTWGPAVGFEWVAEPDIEWRLANDAEAQARLCRHSTRPTCPNNPVAALARTFGGWGSDAYRWWFYCADHMYGRWVEDGQVYQWTTRRRMVPA